MREPAKVKPNLVLYSLDILSKNLFFCGWKKFFAPFAKNLSFSSKLTSEFEIIDFQVVNGPVNFQALQKTLFVNRVTFGNILCSFLQQECSYSIERKNFASVLDN